MYMVQHTFMLVLVALAQASIRLIGNLRKLQLDLFQHVPDASSPRRCDAATGLGSIHRERLRPVMEDKN